MVLKRLMDAWGKRKQDVGVIAPAPALKVDSLFRHEIPEVPDSDGAGTLTIDMNDPWKKLEEQADKENLNAEEWNKLLLEHYPEQTYPDEHRAMIIKNSIEPKPSGSSKVEPSEEGDYKHGFM